MIFFLSYLFTNRLFDCDGGWKKPMSESSEVISDFRTHLKVDGETLSVTNE